MKPITAKNTKIPLAIENKIQGLLRAVGCNDCTENATGIFREVWKAANLRTPDQIPRWSGITDDSTPIELSVQFGPTSAAVRLLWEPQADPASPETYWQAGVALTRWLASRWHAQISTALSIERIFKPSNSAGVYLAVGHAVEFRPESPVFKVYYNAMAQGPSHSREIVGKALNRLGFQKYWKSFEALLGPLDRIELLALNLTNSLRVKIYLRPLQASMDRITELYAIAENAEASDVERMWKAIHGKAKCEEMRPVFLTYELTDPTSNRPSKTSLSIPLFPGLANDAVVTRRVSQLMQNYHISPVTYRRCVKELAERPLAEEEGLHSYVALQRTGPDVAIVAYFNPRFYYKKYGWIARDPVRTWPSAVVSNPRK